MDDSEDEEQRAAGGPGPGAADPERVRSAPSLGWRRYMAQWIHAMDAEGARRWSHEPTAVRPELGLGWPESTHRWTGPQTTCRAASLDCAGWSEERGRGDAGRAQLDRVEGRDLWRTGPSRTTIQLEDAPGPLGVGNATSDGNGTIEIATIRYFPL